MERCISMGNFMRKGAQPKANRPHHTGHEGASGCRDPQHKHMEEFYVALKRGLNEYLVMYQDELDRLRSQMDDMKQSSGLQGDLHNLDKQIKTIESYLERREFIISKADELYEAFCVQSRLWDGATHMKQAFSSSPSTKGTKKSIAELDQQFNEYTENMAALTSELENLVGEFQVKMRGFSGFARLCHTFKYKISIRYGRQRCSLKGRLNYDFSQSFEEETMIFKPLIGDLIDIKVTEQRWLRPDVLAGRVTCQTMGLFTARTQLVSVDITDPGMMKLNLEITWNPFVEDLPPPVSASSQRTPETPTCQDTFFDVLPVTVFGGCSRSSNEKEK